MGKCHNPLSTFHIHGTQLYPRARWTDGWVKIRRDQHLMVPSDSAMPVLNGFDAAREIRAFEEESMRPHAPDPPLSGQISTGPNRSPTTQDNADNKCPHQRPTRRAILVGASAPGAATLSSRYTDAGFDLVMSKPYHVRMIVDLLFGGPATNIVSLYGGIDEKELLEAGYPLQLRPWSPPCETNVRDVVLGR